MDFHKLKIDNYQRIAVHYLPDGVELPFATVDAPFDCLIAFVQTEEQVDEAIAATENAGKETLLILAYPKGTSKNHTSQVNRDTIVAKIQASGKFKAPRLVSLDSDWSGFSFKYTP